MVDFDDTSSIFIFDLWFLYSTLSHISEKFCSFIKSIMYAKFHTSPCAQNTLKRIQSFFVPYKTKNSLTFRDIGRVDKKSAHKADWNIK